MPPPPVGVTAAGNEGQQVSGVGLVPGTTRCPRPHALMIHSERAPELQLCWSRSRCELGALCRSSLKAVPV